MTDIVDEQFKKWVQGKSEVGARVAIFERIRDIPYAVIPELNDSERYPDILKLGKGSCMPKHLLLCNMYRRLGLTVLYAVYPFRWDELEIDYTPKLRRLARAMPPGHHLACKVDIDGKLVLVDATLDPPLATLGLPVNKEWDGESDTLLPIKPSDKEEIYHPSEAYSVRSQPDEQSLVFYNELNLLLDKIRHLQKLTEDI
ncbi:MAG: hypothetical protein FJ012_07765 [Chloroflexi bacterium]|nr:hypothetical protein [Chloroflexota bacterium]